MKKIATVIAMAFIMSILTAGVCFAMEGWAQNEDGTWSFYDHNGDKAVDSWKWSGDRQYWLDDEGIMPVNQVIEDGDQYYYVDETGAMVKNCWKYVSIDGEADEAWMYFANNGRAAKNGNKCINDKYYHFSDGKMEYGWFDANWEKIDDDEDDPAALATYYCGTEDDGHIFKNEWVPVFNKDKEETWVFLGSNNKKVADTKKTINGADYLFDEDGYMLAGLNTATASESGAIVDIKSYTREDGTLLKKGWIYAEDDDNKYWFYADNKGIMAKSRIKKINGKSYAFDSEGHMLTGFVFLDGDRNLINDESISLIDMEDKLYYPQSMDYTDGQYNSEYMYFAENDDPMLQGAAATGTKKFEVNSRSFTVKFANNGYAEIDAARVKGGKLYDNSVLIQAREGLTYAAYCTSGWYGYNPERTCYLVNRSGIVKKNANGVKDGDSTKYWTDANGIIIRAENY